MNETTKTCIGCGELLKCKTLECPHSDYMKPVNISPELANFIKVDSNTPITRVTITKKICEYIKEKDLQNPKDRREIFPDASLKSIFKLTETEKEPLTYYSMQKKIQSHIFKEPRKRIGTDAKINQVQAPPFESVKENRTTDYSGFIADFTSDLHNYEEIVSEMKSILQKLKGIQHN